VVRYGQCVYKCDNDVCDSQVVNVLFQGGTVANLTMTAFTKEVPQKVDIYLTRILELTFFPFRRTAIFDAFFKILYRRELFFKWQIITDKTK
jgi:hypothetical protein